MTERDWFDYLIGIGQLATPLLLLLFTAVGWRLRTRIERQAKLEESLRPDRLRIYNGILEPFVLLFTTDAAWKADPANADQGKDETALRNLLSLEYRRLGFQLSLMGSDGVVRAYNNLVQHFNPPAQAESTIARPDSIQTMSLLGQLLLEIRRSTGNESTKLDNWEMLEWFVTDARRLRHQR